MRRVFNKVTIATTQSQQTQPAQTNKRTRGTSIHHAGATGQLAQNNLLISDFQQRPTLLSSKLWREGTNSLTSSFFNWLHHPKLEKKAFLKVETISWNEGINFKSIYQQSWPNKWNGGKATKRVKTNLQGRLKCGQALSVTLFIFQVFQGQLLGKALNSSAPVSCISGAVWKL